MYSLGCLLRWLPSSWLRAAFWGFVALTPIVIATSETACGAPESFNNLVGGAPPDAGLDVLPEAAGDLTPDPTLPAPRPMIPISLTWVNGSKVKFKWELAPGTIGARVEVCRSRACDREKKTFDGGGSEVLSPDLELGIWFWRLYSKTANTIGTTPSATWEVLVRGGPAQSGGAGGSIVDINGDGKPDLLVTLRSPADADGGVFSDFFPYMAAPDSDSDTTFDFIYNGFTFGAPISSSATEAEAAVIDINGDGFSDVVTNLDFDVSFSINAFPGEAKGLNSTGNGRVDTIPFKELPTLREMGDIDGDGYGDVLIGTRREIVIVHGTPKMLGATEYLLQFNASLFPPDAGFVVPTASVPVGGGFQRNADVYQDVAFFWPYPPEPPDMIRTSVGLLLGAPNDMGELGPVPMGDYTGARSFATGDFDGDGLSDLAFVTTSAAGKASVCTLLTTKQKTEAPECFTPPDPIPAGFASSITAGDLDADGRDEILVGSMTTGIDVLKRADGGGGLVAAHLTTDFGAKVTTIFPGRPGPAIWAATKATSSAEIAVFKGNEQKSVVRPPQGASGFGPLIR